MANRQLEDRPSNLDGEVLDISQQSIIPLLRVLFLGVRSERVVAAQRQWRSNLDQPPSPLPRRMEAVPAGGVSRAVHAAAPTAGAGRRPGTDCLNAGSRSTSSISRRSLLS
jgi:hypothetical protein